MKIYEKIMNLIEKYYRIIFFAILIFATFLNTYRLGNVPNGIHVDEAGMTYDAYCIANYGVDRFLKHLPVYFINFGGGQSALYTYLTAFVIKIAGFYNNTVIRIPALVLSVLEVIIAYFLVKEFKGKKQGLLFMFLVTIMPWHVMKSRWGLDCYLLSPMLLFSIYSLLKAVRGGKLWQYFISGLIFGITLYTYALSYIVIPLFLFLTLIYLIIKKKVTLKQVIIFSIPLFLLAIPLILLLLIQRGFINEIDGFITIPKLHKNRLGEINIKNFKENIKSLKNVFIEPALDYNAISEFGPLYPLGLILMCLGLIFTVIKLLRKGILILAKKEKAKEKTKEIDLTVIMLFAFIANFFLSFLTSLNINKANGIYISATYFIFIALIEFKEKAKIIFTTLVLALVASFILFIQNYFTEFANRDYTLFDNGSIETFKYVYSKKDLENKKIRSDIKYIYSLCANPISPYEFYEDIKMTEVSDGLDVTGYRNYTEGIDLSNIEDDTIYVTGDENTANEIEKSGFTKEQYKRYFILYK